MKKSFTLILLALGTAVCLTNCTKNESNQVKPATNSNVTPFSEKSFRTNVLAKKDTITPDPDIKIARPQTKKDTITPDPY